MDTSDNEVRGPLAEKLGNSLFCWANSKSKKKETPNRGQFIMN